MGDGTPDFIPASTTPDFIPASTGTPIKDTSTIGPVAKTNWTGSAPVSDWLNKKLAPLEDPTEHPVLSRIAGPARKLLPTQHPDEPKTQQNPEGMTYASPLFPLGAGSALLEEAVDPYVARGPAEFYRPQGPPKPPMEVPSIRRTPGQIEPERVSSSAPEPAMRVPAIAQLGGNSVLPEGGGVIQRPPAGLLSAGGPAEAPPEVPKTSLRSLANNIVNKNIPPETPLQRNVPLGQQPRGTPGSTAAMDLRETFGARAKAPEKLPTAITEEVGKQAGAPPLKENVSLREQIQHPDAGGESKQARLERVYPDKGIRQLVHIVGEDMAQAIGGDPQLMRQVADLKKVDVSRAALNLGEDLTDTNISSRKASGDVRPQEMLSRLLKKGHTPSEIIAAARAPVAGK